jgi:hypothetical protein
VCLILIGGGVMRIKYEVVFLRKVLKDLESELERSTDSLNILQAEWSYLNDPSRLEKLSEKYLKDMRPTENSQIINCNDLDSGVFVNKNNSAKRSVTKQTNSEAHNHNKYPKSDRDLQRKSFDEFIKSSLEDRTEEQYN